MLVEDSGFPAHSSCDGKTGGVNEADSTSLFFLHTFFFCLLMSSTDCWDAGVAVALYILGKKPLCQKMHIAVIPSIILPVCCLWYDGLSC